MSRLGFLLYLLHSRLTIQAQAECATLCLRGLDVRMLQYPLPAPFVVVFNGLQYNGGLGGYLISM
jgi:hypothetical protein